MSGTVKPLYVPALRMKAGELMGLRDLAPDIAAQVLPRLIVPPRAERDDDLQRELLSGDGVPAIATTVSPYWRNRPVLIEVTYLIDDFGADTMDTWLPKMIEMAYLAGVKAIPLVSLRDLPDLTIPLKEVITFQGELQLAVRIPSGEMVTPGWRDVLLKSLERIGVAAENCCILADFYDADFSVAARVAGVIQGTLEDLQEAGLWRHIVFQGTNFPDRNPAEPGSDYIVPRNEWHSWQQAVKFDPSTADYLIFGDYGADCANFNFAASRARPIPHYRYATQTSWLVQRGGKTGTDLQIMRKVCADILRSGQFAGRTFSAADDYIYLNAKGFSGPGNSTTWRAVNTNHHVTRVVSDVGAVRNIGFAKREVEELGEQHSLFGEVL